MGQTAGRRVHIFSGGTCRAYSRKAGMQKFWFQASARAAPTLEAGLNAPAIHSRQGRPRMFEGKTLAIIGGTSGIGLRAAQQARQRGARVIIGGRSQARL